MPATEVCVLGSLGTEMAVPAALPELVAQSPVTQEVWQELSVPWLLVRLQPAPAQVISWHRGAVKLLLIIAC